jgi:integrase
LPHARRSTQSEGRTSHGYRTRRVREHSRITLHEYAKEWIEHYQGTGRRGFREETRTEYRTLLDRFALNYFSEQTRLTDITPRHVAGFIAWLCKQTKPAPTKTDKERRVPLSDNTVRNALSPLKACLSTARREGLIRHNPANEATLPHRATVDADEDRPRPFPRVEGEQGEMIETMKLVVQLVPSPHRLMFELLAATGVRRSELLAFEGRHLVLDGARPYVKVRQRVRRRRGEGLVIGPLKSRYSRRDLPISTALAKRLLAFNVAPHRFGIPVVGWHRARPRQSCCESSCASLQERLCRVGWLPYFSTYRRLTAVRRRSQCGSGPALAWSPLGELYARHVRPSARQRPWRAATSRRHATSGDMTSLYRPLRS